MASRRQALPTTMCMDRVFAMIPSRLSVSIGLRITKPRSECEEILCPGRGLLDTFFSRTIFCRTVIDCDSSPLHGTYTYDVSSAAGSADTRFSTAASL
jgi:hypothetical protein